MGSVYRERDRFDDSRTSVSSARRGGDGGGYTTVKRYIVKDDDTRSNYGRRYADRPPERVEETRIIRKEREVEEAPPRRDLDPRFSDRELVIRRERSADPPRRDYDYDDRRREETTDRELVIRRTTEREEPRREEPRREEPRRDERELTISRYDDRRDFRDDRYDFRRDLDDRDIQRYSRTAEYFSPAPQPQTIIIKQEPIIIRERARDDDYQVVRRSDYDDERSVVKRDPRPREEEYFYEKKERIVSPRGDDDDFYEKKSMRREVSPGDSVSQAGGRGRGKSRDYSSDDSMVYVKKVKKTTYDDDDDDEDPHHRRHLLEGVVAGVGAAELLRNHKKKESGDAPSGIGRIGRDVGAGVIGAVGAEAISRYRSRSRRRKDESRSESRSRHRSRSRRRSKSKSKSRSRSRSGSRVRKYAKYGIGAAAIAAAAAIANNRMNKNKEADAGDRRSRSRHRRDSRSSSRSVDDARNPTHRKKRIAEFGLAGAAVAGLVEKARSRSRKPGDRSPSHVRQALPILAAGIGSAALAGLYENNKAGKVEAEAREEQRRTRSRHRSRSRPRDQQSVYGEAPGVGAGNPEAGMIEYGQGNVYGSNYGPGYYGAQDAYGRAPPPDNYYNDQTAVVPAEGAAAGYAGARELRSRSTSRRRSSSRSSGSADERRRRRHRKHGDETAAAAGIGGAAAASEYERRKQEKRDRKARKRAEEQYAYEHTYQPPQQGYTPPPPQGAPDPYNFQSQPNPYPPPPGSGAPVYPVQQPTAPGVFAPGPVYDPAHFPPPPSQAPPQAGGPAYNNNAYAYGANQDPNAPRGRGGDENVSAAPPPRTAPAFGNPFQTPYDQNQSIPDAGINGIPRAPSPPAIHVHPPSVNGDSYPAPTSNLDVPSKSDNISPRSTSVPASSHRKSVQFAETPLVQELGDTSYSSEQEHRSNHRHTRDRGYEAGDDTDSTPDELRRKSEPSSSSRSAQLGPDATGAVPDDRRRRRHHHRRRSYDPQPDRDRDRNVEAGIPFRDTNNASPTGSDETVDLPPRFDEKGKKKTEAGEDPLADKFDQFLGGTGAKMFGNFMDGLFGPDGRKGKGR